MPETLPLVPRDTKHDATVLKMKTALNSHRADKIGIRGIGILDPESKRFFKIKVTDKTQPKTFRFLQSLIKELEPHGIHPGTAGYRYGFEKEGAHIHLEITETYDKTEREMS